MPLLVKTQDGTVTNWKTVQAFMKEFCAILMAN